MSENVNNSHEAEATDEKQTYTLQEVVDGKLGGVKLPDGSTLTPEQAKEVGAKLARDFAQGFVLANDQILPFVSALGMASGVSATGMILALLASAALLDHETRGVVSDENKKLLQRGFGEVARVASQMADVASPKLAARREQIVQEAFKQAGVDYPTVDKSKLN